MVTESTRVAIFGGDGRLPPRVSAQFAFASDLRVFRSEKYAGPSETRRLEAALAAGGIDHVAILTKWNGHSATRRIRRECRRRGVRVELIP